MQSNYILLPIKLKLGASYFLYLGLRRRAMYTKDKSCKKILMIGVIFTLVLLSNNFIFGGGQTQEAVTINFLSWGFGEGGTREAYTHIIEVFEEHNPNIKVIAQPVSSQDYEAKMMSSVIAGNPPDIAEPTLHWIGAIMATGKVFPLNDYIDKALYDDVFKVGWDTSVDFQGKIYGIPFYLSPHVLWYRKDNFERKGISTAPVNWNEYIETAKKLTEKNQYGVGICRSFPQFFIDFMATADSSPVEPTEKGFNITINNSGTIKALELYSSLDQYAPPGDIRPRDLRPLVANGTLSMMVDGPWVEAMFEVASPGSLKYIGASIIPAPEGYSTKTTISAGNMIVFNDTPEEKREAAIKLGLFYGSKEGQQMHYEETGNLPVRKSLSNIVKEPYGPVYMEMLSHGIRGNLGPSQSKVWEIVGRMMYAVITGVTSPEEAMLEAEAELKKVYPE